MLKIIKKNLPHIEIGLYKNSAVAVAVIVEDYELFDFIDDFVTEVCGLDWQYKAISKEELGEVHTMYFNLTWTSQNQKGFLPAS